MRMGGLDRAARFAFYAPGLIIDISSSTQGIILGIICHGRRSEPGRVLMSLAPLLDAAPAIPLHAFAAMSAFVLGLVQFAAPKGTLPHRTLGWIWVLLMAAVAASSFWIHQIRLVGPWSPIHLLSIFTLADAAAGRLARASAPRRRSSPRHDRHLLRRPCRRRAVHAAAGADHAHGRVRALAPGSEPLPIGCFRRAKTPFREAFPGPGSGAAPGGSGDAVSHLEKRR